MHAYVNILEDYNESGGSCFCLFPLSALCSRKGTLLHCIYVSRCRSILYVKIRESVCSFLVLHVSFFLQNNIIFSMLREN